ncbi:ATP-grasp domain-containing protein [Enterococcus faecium]|uniref:ATP-grasp domain-containing protein n=1 Tax=Enterococcus faecium TaxID=1352 RepID=UPI0033900555
MNILVLSCGTRNKIIQYLKRGVQPIGGRVICADISSLAPALYEADVHYLVPRYTEENFLEVVLTICENEKINGILSLIDPEVALLAENKELFENQGTKVIGSGQIQNEYSFDKYKMFTWLTEHHFLTAKTFLGTQKEEIVTELNDGSLVFPLIRKPRNGSASIDISIIQNEEDLKYYADDENIIYQEFISGQEIGVDAYLDMINGKLVNLFMKKKIKMRSGETDKSVSFFDDRLFKMISKFTENLGYTGVIDIDVFYVNGEYMISEVNPRFGGGYPHAYECGVNMIDYIINNLNGIVNVNSNCGEYPKEVVMMKYNEVMIRKLENEV